MKERLKDPQKEGLWSFFRDSLLGVFTGDKVKARSRRAAKTKMPGRLWRKRKSRLQMTKRSRRRNR